MKKTIVTLFAALALATSTAAFADNQKGVKHGDHQHCSEECMKECKEKHGTDCKDGECPMEKKAKKAEKKN